MKRSDKTPSAPAADNAGLQHAASKTAKRARPWLKKYQWQPGTSGNKSGKRAGAVSITAALKRELARGKTVDQVARAIIKAVVEKGDAGCLRVLMDRTDGLLTQSLQAHLEGQLFAPTPAPQVAVQILIPSNGRGDSDADREAQATPSITDAPSANVVDGVDGVDGFAPTLPDLKLSALVGNPALRPEPEQAKAKEPSPALAHDVQAHKVQPEPEETPAESAWRRECERIDRANRAAAERIAQHGELQAYGHRYDKPTGNSL